MSTLLPSVLEGLPLERMSYLELGVLGGQCFNRVPAEKKVGVDISPRFKSPHVWVGTTDDYFAQARDSFDLVLVDACHEFGQVCRDLAGCARVLRPGGLVFCHDMVPPTPQHVSKNFCWDTYRVLGWCLRTDVPLWVTTEDFGLVALPYPERVKPPNHFALSFGGLHALLKEPKYSDRVLSTGDFKTAVKQYLLASR